MTDPLLVSVVVNNFNYGEYVAAAIESALTQTHARVEVVVVDDGSIDDSREVIARYADRARVVLQDNGGQAAALNAGVAATTGDVVLLLDADDRLHPDAAKIAAELFESNSGATLLQFRMRVTDAKLTPVGTTVPPAHVRLPQGDVRDAVMRWTLPSALGPGGAIALPRAAAEVVFPIPVEGLRYGPDTFVVRAAALLGPVASRDTAIADYRSHGRNDSNRDALDLDYLRLAMQRQVAVGEQLREWAMRHAAPPPSDVLAALDPIFLSHRLTSVCLEPTRHPFSGDTRVMLARGGVEAALRRPDLSWPGRLVHATWFLAMLLAPTHSVARWLATKLLFPLSRRRR